MSWTASLKCTPFRKDDAQEAAKLETSVTMTEVQASSTERRNGLSSRKRFLLIGPRARRWIRQIRRVA